MNRFNLGSAIMKRQLFISMAVVAAFISCSKEVQPEDDNQTPQTDLIQMEFIGSSEVDTKAGFTAVENGRRSIQWTGTTENTDDISVLWSTDASNHQKFSTTESGATATFTGLAEDVEEFYAVYPYQDGLTLNNGTISGVTLKHEQTAVAGNFDKDAFLAIAKTNNSAFNFKNVSAFVSFILSDATNVEYVTFTGNNSENVAGTGTLTYDETTPKFAISSNYQKMITLRPEAGESFEAGQEYFISVCPVTFTKGFTIAVHYTDGTIKNTHIAGKSIGSYRNTIKSFGTVDLREDFKATLPNNLYVAWLHGYDIDIAGATINKETLATATFINKSDQTISNAGLYFIDSSAANLGINGGTYNGLYIIGNTSDRVDLKVNGTVTFSGLMKNISFIENTNTDMFKTNANGSIRLDNCHLATASNRTQLFYVNTTVQDFSMYNCDIKVMENGKQLWKLGENGVFTTFDLQNNIFYSDDASGKQYFEIVQNGAITNLYMNNNTVAEVYNCSSGSMKNYFLLGSLNNLVMKNNLFYLSKYAETTYNNSSYSAIIKASTMPTTGEVKDNVIYWTSTDARLKITDTNLDTTIGKATATSMNDNTALVDINTLDIPNGVIAPVGIYGATR